MQTTTTTAPTTTTTPATARAVTVTLLDAIAVGDTLWLVRTRDGFDLLTIEEILARL